MPTHNNETLAERYQSEHAGMLDLYASMKPAQIHAVCVELHNALAQRDAFLAALKEILLDADLAGEKTSLRDVDGHLERIREEARAAIAKATGGAV